MLYPAHLLAHKEVLVVTFNYRIGALGMLCWQLILHETDCLASACTVHSFLYIQQVYNIAF